MERYRAAIHDFRELLYELPHTRNSAAIEIFCSAGMHRSVAMAERLTDHIRRYWPWVRVEGPKHYTLRTGLLRHQERAARRGVYQPGMRVDAAPRWDEDGGWF